MPSSPNNAGGLSKLYGEHLLLGATFKDGRVVESYANEQPAGDVLLSDISDMSVLLFAGNVAESFANVGFAGKELSIGECAFEAVLTGEGTVVSIPLLVRTGQHEFIACDISPRGDVLSGWLSFLSSVNEGGNEPFAGLDTQDATGTHVALLLAGDVADRVLSDYIKQGERLPKRGHVARCMLDDIPCIVVCVGLGTTPAYLLLVPPLRAVALWRSLLSFPEVVPVGRKALEGLFVSKLPWAYCLSHGGTLRMDEKTLAGEGLIRSNRSFVGARGLNSQKG